MKKTLLMIGVAALAVLIANPVSAQEKQATATGVSGSSQTGQGNFIDTNQDGICDHFATRGNGRGQGPGQGKGFRNGNSWKSGSGSPGKKPRTFQRGPGFVDANQDGICDQAGKGRKGKGFCRANRKPVLNRD